MEVQIRKPPKPANFRFVLNSDMIPPNEAGEDAEMTIKPTPLQELIFKLQNADPLLLFVAALVLITISAIAIRLLFSKRKDSS
jgi:hypothetical protein